MPPENSDLPPTFSDLLESLRQGDPRLTLEEMVEAFGERGIGALMLTLALLSLLPLPPGVKAIFCIPLTLLALELAAQRHEVWLPRWVLRRSVSRATYARVIVRVLKPVRYFERLSRPRLAFLSGAISRFLIGLTCVFLAVMLALPVPFGDMLPSMAMLLFALGVMQRDGVVVLLGWLGAAISAAYLLLIWSVVVAIIERLISWGHIFF